MCVYKAAGVRAWAPGCTGGSEWGQSSARVPSSFIMTLLQGALPELQSSGTAAQTLASFSVGPESRVSSVEPSGRGRPIFVFHARVQGDVLTYLCSAGTFQKAATVSGVMTRHAAGCLRSLSRVETQTWRIHVFLSLKLKGSFNWIGLLCELGSRKAHTEALGRKKTKNKN